MASASCVVSVELDEGDYLCETEPRVCPDGLVCIDGLCQQPVGPATSFRRAIAVADQGSLTGSPLLVTLNPDRIDYAKAAADGSDVEFRDGLGSILDHQIETWDPSGQSVLWVHISELPADRILYLHYGGEPSAPSSTSLFADHDVVYHFGDGVRDSGLKGLSGTPENGAMSEPGWLGEGCGFDGVDDRVFGGSDLDLFRADSGITAAMWVKPAVLGSSLLEITNNVGDATRMFISVQSTGEVRFGIREDDVAGPSESVGSVGLLELDQWTWIVVSADLSAQTMRIYLNGVLDAEGVGLLIDPVSVDANASQLILGQDDNVAMTGSYTGTMDEFRILPRAVDDAWVTAQYASMTDQLLTFGVEEPLFD